MNPTKPRSTRLVCRLTRQWHALAAGDLPRSGHVADCIDCREYFLSCKNLELGLQREAGRNRPAIPQGLDHRIFAALRESGEHPRSSRPKTERFATIGIGLIAAALVVGAYLRSTNLPKNGIVGAENQTNVVAMIDAAQSASSEFWQMLEPSAVQLATNNPLQRELDSVYADAQNAMGFLALNFLPAPAEGNEPSPQARGSAERG